MDAVDISTLRIFIEKGGSTFRLKSLLVLSNLVDLKLIGARQLDWLFPLVDSVPETWSVHEYSIAIPLLRAAGLQVGELTCQVYGHVVAREKLPIAEWIVRNAEGLGVQLHLRVVPAHQPQST